MKIVIILSLLFILGCKKDPSVEIYTSTCFELGETLDGSVYYDKDSTPPCIIKLETSFTMYFYTEKQALGFQQGLQMATNRSKVKDYVSCLRQNKAEEIGDIGLAVTVDRFCKEKVGWK
jgi:hypothetical protein